MKLSIILAATFLVGGQAWAKASKSDVNKVAVGQGISSPAVTVPVNFRNGFTYQNSAVAASLSGVQLSLEYATDSEEKNGNPKQSGYGAEVGVGNGKAGLIAGYYKNDCDNCDGRIGAIGGMNFSKVGIGLGFREKDTISGGFLFNPQGQHRVGVTVDTFNKDASGNDYKGMNYGIGYSFDAKNWLFALDASKVDGDAFTSDDKKLIKVTPGFQVKAKFVTLAVSYDMYLNDDNDLKEDQVWGGIGFGNDRVQFAAYYKYVNDYSAALTFWF